MIDLVRQEILTTAHTVVVKVGTSVLADDDGSLNLPRIQHLADQVCRIRDSGRKVALVSSGAVGAGIGRLGLGNRPADLRQLQACAAVGQSYLMRAWEEALGKHGVATAQILLTAGDFDNRGRYLNARNTILTLFEWGVVPIINENDTVSVDEIRFGDNDLLAAQVTNLLQAPLLILLSVVDGLHASDPQTDANAEIITTVDRIDQTVTSLAGSGQSMLGTGGMRTKIRAAELAVAAGESVIMANGAAPHILDEIIAAEPKGTLFLPQRTSMPAWKRWLGYSARVKGKVTLDAGAVRAVKERGRSLLPIGVIGATGRFDKGDVISLCDVNSGEFARGLSNYAAADACKISGLRTDEIAKLLGVVPYEELVHRDNLVVIS